MVSNYDFAGFWPLNVYVIDDLLQETQGIWIELVKNPRDARRYLEVGLEPEYAIKVDLTISYDYSVWQALLLQLL